MSGMPLYERLLELDRRGRVVLHSPSNRQLSIAAVLLKHASVVVMFNHRVIDALSASLRWVIHVVVPMGNPRAHEPPQKTFLLSTATCSFTVSLLFSRPGWSGHRWRITSRFWGEYC